MQLSKFDYYTEILVYPPLALTLAVAAWCGPHSSFHLGGLAEFLMGVVIWTLIEYLIHRVLLHSLPSLSGCMTCITPARQAFLGTPTRVSLAEFVAGALFPLWWLAGSATAGCVTAGLVLGYFGTFVHDAVHRPPRDRKSLHYAAKLRHMRHHIGGGEGHFGVTVALWDRLLGTFVEPSTPHRCRWTGTEMRS
jgi:hypothetical protein